MGRTDDDRDTAEVSNFDQRLRTEEIGLIVDGDLPATPQRRGGSGSVLAAAMLAVGEILEPEKASVEIAEEAADRDVDGLDGIRLDFGELPPLN